MAIKIQYSEDSIDSFLTGARVLLKRTTVKMHILEEHCIPMIRWLKVQLGFYAEQGKIFARVPKTEFEPKTAKLGTFGKIWHIILRQNEYSII